MNHPRDQAFTDGGKEDDIEIGGEDAPSGNFAAIQAIKADKNAGHHTYLDRIINASDPGIQDSAKKWRDSSVSTRKVYSNVLYLLGRYFWELDIHRLEVSSNQPELTQRFLAHWREDVNIADSSKITYRATIVSFFKEVLGIEIESADLPAKRVQGSRVWGRRQDRPRSGRKSGKDAAVAAQDMTSRLPTGFLDYPFDRTCESSDFLKLELKGTKVVKMPSVQEAKHLAEMALYFFDKHIAKEQIDAGILMGDTGIATDFQETFGHAPAFLASMRQLGVMNADSFELTPNFITRLTASDELDRWAQAMIGRFEKIRRITYDDFQRPYLYMPKDSNAAYYPSGDPIRFFKLHSQKMLKIRIRQEEAAPEFEAIGEPDPDTEEVNGKDSHVASGPKTAAPTVKEVAAEALQAALQATAIACDIDAGKLRERLIQQGVIRQNQRGVAVVV